MKLKYEQQNLIDIHNDLHVYPDTVVLNGTTLTVSAITAVARLGKTVEFTNNASVLQKITECYAHMISDVKAGIPIYGCNTGYGARAGRVLNQGNEAQRLDIAQKISESIVHTDVTVGPELGHDVIRAAMLIRVNMLLQGVSAVRLEDLNLYRTVLNINLIPIVHAYGGLGASGDLAHNSRVVSALRQLPGTFMWDEKGKKHEARRILRKNNIEPLLLEPKAGLGLVNGDNFSTAAAALIAKDLVDCMIVADLTGALVIEALMGSNRTFHPLLANVRPHAGQKEVSQIYRYLLRGSKLAYQEMTGQLPREKGVKIQDAYSLRCLAQSDGLSREQIKWVLDTITTNANAVSDNPLWVPPGEETEGEDPWKWVSGGNFFAMHMSEVIDIMRKIMTRLIKRNDRHLHRLVSPHENNGLPANLSDKRAISACTFKGVQLQSGMFDVYSMILAQPVNTLFGIHEESNQDITPHALTSAILAWENMRLLRYSLAMNLLAVAQAVDLRGGKSLLSPKTRPIYEFVRGHVGYVTKEQPLAPQIERIATTISDGTLSGVIRKEVFGNYPHE